jgi:hypothetical protein
MLPPFEMDRLRAAIHQANTLAAAGRLGDGYGVLMQGRLLAAALARAGVPWGQDLVAYWQAACETYVELYGTALPHFGPPDVRP